MKIYSKTGDRGETGLVGGQRISKGDALMESVGDVDELNSAIGLCRLHAAGSELDPLLRSVQEHLFEIGAELATPTPSRFVNETLSEVHVSVLEASIDKQQEALTPLANFVLPGGSPLGAHLHHARAVCRRAERAVARTANEGGVRPVVLEYLNRLSDWLFVAARTANRASGVEDVKWVSGGV
jgi:cob(I)alamin adenosyltransferase